MRWLSRLVSVAVILAILFGASALLRSKMPTTQVGESFALCARFRDGSRLAVGSPVRIAGVRIGDVASLTVDDGFARVEMRLRDDSSIPTDSWITKKAESAFGDSYLEIIPGGPDEGAPPEGRLRSGQCIAHVIEGGSTDTVLRSISRTMPKVDRGLDRVHEVAMTGRKWASGTLEDAVLRADRWIAEGHIDQPLASAEHAMERADSATGGAAQSVHDAAPGVDRTLARLDRGIANARKQMADVKQGLHDGLENARNGMDRIDPTVADLTEVLSAVDQGKGDDFKGTLGRLVNDPGVANTIEDATETVRDGVAGLNRFKSWLGVRFEQNIVSGLPRFYATAEIRARNDKFYLIELEKGFDGAFPSDQLSDGAGVPQYYRSQQIRDALRFTGEFGKTFGGVLQLRGGVKDSTFGFGTDVLLNDGRLRLSADVFGGFAKTPRLKLAAALEVYRSIYLLAGVDDVLNPGGNLQIVKGNSRVPYLFGQVHYGRDYFLGATLHFTDADLALLLRVYGAMIVALL